MFTPKFTLNRQLIELIGKVESLHGRLEGMQIPRNLLLNLERDNLLQSSYSSNSIEGNPLNLNEVTNLILNEREPANRNEAEVRNYFDILSTLNNYVEGSVDKKMIETVHARLMRNVRDDIAGKLRNSEVVVGKRTKEGGVDIKHNPPYHTIEGITNEVNQLSDWLKDTEELPLLKAGIFHHRYVYIHPFVDGNGRTCRLLTTLLLMQDGYQINKYFVLDDYYNINKKEYSDKLSTADKGDLTEWLEYFLNGVVVSLESALDKVEQGLDRGKIELRPTKREAEALEFIKREREIKSSQLADALEISRGQAHVLLQGLVEKGLVEKFGSTKSSYYKLV